MEYLIKYRDKNSRTKQSKLVTSEYEARNTIKELINEGCIVSITDELEPLIKDARLEHLESILKKVEKDKQLILLLLKSRIKHLEDNVYYSRKDISDACKNMRGYLLAFYDCNLVNQTEFEKYYGDITNVFLNSKPIEEEDV